jgi:L-alanine-DL-glutamate epimerase-like enolase superfamily enzyme
VIREQAVKIVEVEAIPLNLRFRPAVALDMLRAVTHRPQLTLYRLRLDNGAEGYGDRYGPVDDVSQWRGRSALEALHGSGHGGIEMAAYDAVGQALGVPAHRLMGRAVHQQVPFAYWTIDLPPAVLAEQVKTAARLGYTSYKFKCRPWWDPREQLAAAAAAAPAGFRLWLDFNGHLREARLALPVLGALEELECVAGFESPIPQRDVEGYRLLRRKLSRPIVGHVGGGCCHVVSDDDFDRGVPLTVQLTEAMFDGFVMGSDIDQLRNQAGVAQTFHKPFWIQYVGTALRAAWIAHLASTCEEALLSHLAAHDLWAEDIAPAPPVVDGWMAVGQAPGLGLRPDPAAIEALRQAAPAPVPRTISTVIYPSGRRWHFADEQQRHEAFYFGHLPGFTAGIRLAVETDDGSAAFAARHARCRSAPMVE